jgi:hypothetical protein
VVTERALAALGAVLKTSARRKRVTAALGVRERRLGPLERLGMPVARVNALEVPHGAPVGRSHRQGRQRGLLVDQGRDL